MEEIRKNNIIINKDGHGSINYKMSIPKKWADELGFSEKNRNAIIEIIDNKIIIRKEEKNMLLIKNENVKYVSSVADYELENGLLLFEEDWNGEIYSKGFDPKNEKEINNEYKPVYRYELDNINIDDLEENSDEWNKALEIVGFQEI